MRYERGSEGFTPVLAFSIPIQIPYSTCKMSVFAPQIPLNLAFDVSKKWKSLSRLQAGHTLRIFNSDQGPTDKGASSSHTPADQECVFSIALDLWIHRLSEAELAARARHR
jgi:hypothetical protein